MSKKHTSCDNRVPGFSRRFSKVLDLAGAPGEGRYSWGARRYGVAVNSFRNWTLLDISPKYEQLARILDDLQSQLTGSQTTPQLIAWLYSGEHNPFEVLQAYSILEAYRACVPIALDIGIEIGALSPSVLDTILTRVSASMAKEERPPGELERYIERIFAGLQENAAQISNNDAGGWPIC